MAALLPTVYSEFTGFEVVKELENLTSASQDIQNTLRMISSENGNELESNIEVCLHRYHVTSLQV